MALKIIGAGFGRTGTFSLKLALEQLGFGPCYHMYEVREHPQLLAPWLAALQGELPDWDKVFAGYTSQVDWPASYYWKELHSAYPDAKVILSVRDPEAWYTSLQATIVPSVTIGREMGDNAHAKAASDMIYQTIYQGLFQGRMSDKPFVMSVFRKHIQEVRDTIPANQLLEFDAREGWGRLCKFLAVPVPSTAYPETNSTEDFLKKKPYLRAALTVDTV